MPDIGATDASVEMAVLRVTQHADFASKFKHPIKFNGKDFVEHRLSPEQQLAEVSKSASSALHVFLERYGMLLAQEELRALATSPAAETAEARIWLERLLREPPSAMQLSKVRRRRRWVWAKREMVQASGYFCEDEMKRRDPQLFHHLVGQHSDSSIRLSAPMQGSLSQYLMQQLDKDCQAELLGAQSASLLENDAQALGRNGAGFSQGTTKRKRGEDNETDDSKIKPPNVDDLDYISDDEADDRDLDGEESAAPRGSDDMAVRRARFLKVMRDRFMDGKERAFDYAVLDEDSDLDDMVELGRDAEERYFDDD
eukprot:TRINITY_DN50411_c0_g1_i1.p1 TRINITY_DN50411_c0_g1~~TRINITY_DN50411_c0_g1_i1.p1  ORF type:complete len:313 (-),score=88.97 TRINITY_DN50411_c0_g1_i1:164-1102(-)